MSPTNKTPTTIVTRPEPERVIEFDVILYESILKEIQYNIKHERYNPQETFSIVRPRVKIPLRGDIRFVSDMITFLYPKNCV